MSLPDLMLEHLHETNIRQHKGELEIENDSGSFVMDRHSSSFAVAAVAQSMLLPAQIYDEAHK